MKIRKLHLKNYKVFDDLELDFTDANGETLNEIVIAGVNGSGKTTVLEFIRDTLTKKPNNNTDNYALFSFPDADTAYSFSDFMNKDKVYNGNNKYFGYFNDKSNRNVFNDRNNRNFVNVKICQKTEMSGNLEKVPSRKTGIGFTPKTLNRAIFRPSNDRISSDETSNVKEISFSSHKDEMKNLILQPIRDEVFGNKDLAPKKMIEHEIAAINSVFNGLKLNSKFVDINDTELIFESINGKKIFFEDLSNGEKFIYFMGFMLKRLNINNSIIIIDEPEDSLHPTWQQQILKFYSNIGENNQVILATHSPHIIGSAKAENVFLLKPENGKVTVSHPRYSKGHSIPYVLSEVMGTDYRNTRTGNIVDEYLRLIDMGMHETEQGQELWAEIKQLDPNSEERNLIDLSLRRFKVLGK